MARKTENYSTDFIASNYYTKLVEARLKCNASLTESELNESPEAQEEFKQLLTFLVREMYPKYQRREDIDPPEVLEKHLQEKDHLNVSKLTMKDCRKILRNLNDLQEKLGIVSRARSEYEVEKEGAEDKNKGGK